MLPRPQGLVGFQGETLYFYLYYNGNTWNCYGVTVTFSSGLLLVSFQVALLQALPWQKIIQEERRHAKVANSHNYYKNKSKTF